jgi:hypothetical protein
VAADQAVSTDEDTAVAVTLTASDVDGDALTYSVVDGPANGVLSGVAPNVTYTPDPDYNGPDSFTFRANDGQADSNLTTVNITVDPVNDPPVAADQAVSTDEDTAVAITLVGSDVDGDALTYSVVDGPTNGVLNGTPPNVTYTPDPGYDGADSFTFRVNDGTTDSNLATVNITVSSANDPPVANDDSENTPEDTPVTIDVAANDADPDGNLDPTSANGTCANGSVGCNGAANGYLTDNEDGTITYSPSPDYNGADSFVYEICDTGTPSLCDTATVDLTINPINDPPAAVDDSATTPEDTPVTIDVSANDTDPDGNLDPTSANSSCANGSSGCLGAANGSLTDNGDGTITYTPNPAFSGSDSFIYEICDSSGQCDTASVSITSIPLVPATIEVRVAASSDDAEENTSGRVALTSRDLELVYDKGDQTVGIRFNGVAIPAGATIVNAYVQFKVGETTTEATALNIQGEAHDNAPTFDNTTGDISSRSRTAAAVPWSPESWEANGEAGPDQQTPDIASVIEEIVGQPGWSSGNSLVIIITGTGKRVAESYNGDKAGAPLLHVEYRTAVPNNPPVASDDSAITPEDTLVTIDVAANDSDPDDNLVSASANTACATCTGPTYGSLVNGGDGTFDYTPNPDYSGGDSFVYEICDSGTPSLCDTAVVNVTVDPVDDAPVANVDSAAMPEETAVTIDVAANDTDPDGDLDPSTANSACAGCADPSNGNLTNNGDGTFTYTPNPGFSGADSFVYEICDTGGLCDTAAVNLTVSPVNGQPVASDDSAITPEDTLVTIDVAANDSDPDDNLVSASANTACATCTGPTYGSLVNGGDGTFDYTPNPDYSGGDSFVYEICDSGTPSLCDTAAVNITVDPVDDAPVANVDSAATPEETAVTINVAANDTDPDGNLDPASANTACATCTGATFGTLVGNGDGTFTYTPNPGFSGADSFVYEICDTGALCDTAAVNLTVIKAALVYGPSDDAMVSSKEPLVNYGTSTSLEVRSHSNETIHSYLKFVVTGVTGTIKSAKLRLFANKSSSSGGSIVFVSNDYVASSTPWTEDALTWENAPLLDGTQLDTTGAVDAGTWVEFDVTAAIQGDGIHSFGLNSTSTNRATYGSKEAAENFPILIIEVESGS